MFEIQEPVHPAVRYVNLLLLDMLQSGKDVCTITRSAALPALRDCDPPAFERLRNRLKIMSDLDPVIYPTPRGGRFLLAIARRIDGKWYDCTYAVHVLFADAAGDPSVELRADLTEQTPGVDPDLCLY